MFPFHDIHLRLCSGGEFGVVLSVLHWCLARFRGLPVCLILFDVSSENGSGSQHQFLFSAIAESIPNVRLVFRAVEYLQDEGGLQGRNLIRVRFWECKIPSMRDNLTFRVHLLQSYFDGRYEESDK